MGNTAKRCYDCGCFDGHYPWCGVKHLEQAKPVGREPLMFNEEKVKKAIDALPLQTWQQPSLAGSYNVISSPAHYARFAIQPIDFIEANGLDFLQASVLKYLVRFPYKNGVEDLHKARDMLNRLIKREEQKLVRDAGEQVGRDPAPENPAGCTDRGGCS